VGEDLNFRLENTLRSEFLGDASKCLQFVCPRVHEDADSGSVGAKVGRVPAVEAYHTLHLSHIFNSLARIFGVQSGNEAGIVVWRLMVAIWLPNDFLPVHLIAAPWQAKQLAFYIAFRLLLFLVSDN